ncbi:MAG TPA: quinoprotein dehydrogenase-associated SoxYZ-like carrier [Burkholderiales bacterium]|nr:quinoprotein dehydrogenase-associated SoxYZ-like carrier [Burkholderiales bacterium]
MRSAFFVVLLSLFALNGAAADDSANPDTEIWRKVRADLFGDRAIVDDAGTRSILLQIPARAADAAVVPLSIRIRPSPLDAPTWKLYVIIDRNPSPIAGIFEFGKGSGGPEMETRVRIEEYTWVRVIAERADGSLLIAQRFIKAAGGCSAPAGKSLAERLAGMGQMKWRVDSPADPSGPLSVQLMIRHPNNSGLAMDQLTHLYDPPYYVRNVRVTRGDELVFAADVDFSISENPAFRFTLRPAGGVLHARVTDSNERVFESSAP